MFKGHGESAIDSASSNAGRERETYLFAPLYEIAYMRSCSGVAKHSGSKAPYGKLSSSTIGAGVQIFFCDQASPWQRPTSIKNVPR
jgi:hypothetical protein